MNIKGSKSSWFRTATALTSIGAVAFSFLTMIPPASADISPAGCKSNDFVVNLQKSTNTAYDETNPNGATTIVYTADAGNPNNDGQACDVDGVTITITDPHGVVHTIQTGGSYPAGTPVASLAPTVSYVANSADEVSSNLSASVSATGSLHDKVSGTDPLNSGKTVSVTVIHPNTAVTVTPSATAVQSGGTVNLTVTEKNTGDDPFASSSVGVTLTPPGTLLTESSASFTGGDTNNNGFLDPNETWTWVVNGVTVSTSTTYTAVGNAIDDMGNHVTIPSYPTEQASTTVNIVNAKISITPNGTNEINHKHIFTGHVDVDNGSGFVSAPSGTVISFASASGPGTFDAPSCTTVAATGSCTDGLTSATPGVTVVNASTDVTVGGVLLHRTTDGTNGNSGPATKTWVDANIQISPLQATDPVGDIHTLTGHVNINVGTSTYVNAPSGTVISFAIASGPGSLGSLSCATIGATGSCTDTLTSTSTGTTVINATTDVVVGGVTIHRTTDGIGLNSGSANKTWVMLDSNIVTAIHNASHLTITTSSIGSTVHDSATVTPSSTGPTPTGKVDFTFYTNGSCNGDGSSAGQVTLNGSGIADPSNSEGPLAAGSYSFKAHYEGDGTYNASNASCEPLTVGMGNTSVTTKVQDPSNNDITSSTVPVGTAVHDAAFFGSQIGNFVQSGTVTYNFYPNGTCSNATTSAETVTISGGTIPASTPQTPGSGSYSYQAVYSGDANYNSVTGACEPFAIAKSNPSISTTPNPATANLGATLNDSATLTGGSSPSGTVTFGLFAPSDATCSASPAYTQVVPLTGTNASTSPGFVSNAAGTWHWTASYSGDAANNATSSGCAAEPVTIHNFTVRMTTTIHLGATDNGTPVVVTSTPAGSTVHDSAGVVPPVAIDPLPTGKVDFTFFNNGSCDGTGSSAGQVNLINGKADPSTAEGPLAPGSYSFSAHYEGDTNYPNGATSTCELLTVNQNQPTVTTLLSSSTVNVGTAVHDTATLTGATSGAGGTATYSVYSGNACTGAAVASSTVTVVSSSIPMSADFTPLTAGTFNWQIVYSGDTNNAGATSACQSEVLTVVQPVVQYCSPGYWKQDQHFDSWVTYNPTDKFSAVFGRTITILWSDKGKPASLTDPTLLQALEANGGGINLLARASVDALLNATSLKSGFTSAQVISITDTAIDAGTNAAYQSAADQFTNPENCPLN